MYLWNLSQLKGFWMKVYYFTIEERQNSVNKVMGGQPLEVETFKTFLFL